jgi:hypothetical protein
MNIADLPGTENAKRFEGHTAGSTISAFLSHHAQGTDPPCTPILTRRPSS